MTYANFSAAIAKAGLTARDCGHGHWQVTGGAFVVNCWPWAKGGATVHVAKTNKGRKVPVGACAAACVQMATALPPVQPCRWDKTERLRESRRIRRRLHKTYGDKCHWCAAPLTLNESTLDHVVPLARGGTNGHDNLRLACAACNHDRGHDMPELKGRAT